MVRYPSRQNWYPGKPYEEADTYPLAGGLTSRYIHESNLIEGVDVPYYDQCANEAWEHLWGYDTLSVAAICETHSLLMRDSPIAKPGQLRESRVWMRYHEIEFDLLPWEKVPEQLAQWVNTINEDLNKLDPMAMHQQFEHIHPFTDGNGRVGRLLLWWHELRIGRAPTLLLAQGKDSYFEDLTSERVKRLRKCARAIIG